MSASRIKALIFDLDGTLYLQAPVRRAMLLRLVRAHLFRPREGLATFRSLRAYRQAQEELRHRHPGSADLALEQLQCAASRLGVPVQEVAPCMARWMEREPLSLLAGSLRAGAIPLLEQARRGGLRLAVFSDYPAQQKLEAMGIAGLFDGVVSAQDPAVQRFKPDPKGLEVILQRFSLRGDEAVYIGDRPDIDAAAAARAGMESFILRPGQSFQQLSRWLEQQTGCRT